MTRKPYYNLEHQQEYRKKTKSINLSFNLSKEEELELFNYISEKPNKTNYIKELIKKDIEK